MLPNNASPTVTLDYPLADGTFGVHVGYHESAGQSLRGYGVTLLADSIIPVNEGVYGSAGEAHTDQQLLEVRNLFVDEVTGEPVDHADIWPKLSPQRISTFVLRFPRCVLAEKNTHRVFSRNSASSRARSIKVVITEVMEDPYVPLFSLNQRGMSGPLASASVQDAATVQWLRARDSAVASVLSMLLGKDVSRQDVENGLWRELTDDYYQRVYLDNEEIPGALNLHKQNINRLLEPFMWHEAVVTSTEWENFLELRDHDDADPAIHVLARLMKLALAASTPVSRSIHAPFAGNLVKQLGEQSHLYAARQILAAAFEAANYTAGASAQVSYRPVSSGGTGADPVKLANRLLSMMHLSPFEHAAFGADWLKSMGVEGNFNSNFSEHWVQHRSLIRELEVQSGKKGLDAVLEMLNSV